MPPLMPFECHTCLMCFVAGEWKAPQGQDLNSSVPKYHWKRSRVWEFGTLVDFGLQTCPNTSWWDFFSNFLEEHFKFLLLLCFTGIDENSVMFHGQHCCACICIFSHFVWWSIGCYCFLSSEVTINTSSGIRHLCVWMYVFLLPAISQEDVVWSLQHPELCGSRQSSKSYTEICWYPSNSQKELFVSYLMLKLILNLFKIFLSKVILSALYAFGKEHTISHWCARHCVSFHKTRRYIMG